MGKKRKSDASRLEEVERGMYSTFCSAANSLSQIYTQAMNHQKLSFHAGERHAMEKLYQWILRQHEEVSRVTTADIVAYLQHEMDNGGEDASTSPRSQAPHHLSQSIMHNTSIQPSIGSFRQATVGLALRVSHVDQAKNLVLSNALSSPFCRSLQSCHLPQEGGYYPDDDLNTGNRSRMTESIISTHNCDRNSNDSSMDIHSDSPPHSSY